MAHEKQEKVIKNKNWTTEEPRTLEVAGKDFKMTVINMLSTVEEKMDDMDTRI